MSRSQRPFKPDEHEIKALKDLYKKLGKPLPDNLKDKTSQVNRSKLARNPSFDINETPATRRTRKIRKLQEGGVGGEAGNASDILKKGIQLPNIQAKNKKKKKRTTGYA